jgi:hypothetical protein
MLQLTLFFTTLTTLAVVHISATKFFLYWKYLWFDIPVHFLGGVCVALGLSALPFFRIYVFEKYRTPLVYTAGVLTVGVLWEIFEVTSGIMIIDETFVSDTTLDLTMDVLGGLVGYAVAGTFKKL